MSEKESSQKLNIQPPADSDDEQFWQNFSRDLWLLFKKAEELESGAPNQAEEALKFENAPKLRAHCLVFARCAEIGRGQAAADETEKTHLENCRFCSRRVEKFGETATTESAATAAGKIGEIVSPGAEPKKSWWARLFPSAAGNGKFSWSPTLAVGFAALAVIFFGASAFVLLQNVFNERGGEISEAVSSPPDNSAPAPNISNAAAGNENLNAGANNLAPDGNSEANDSSPLSKPRKKNAAQTDGNSDDNRTPAEFSSELAALPPGERAAVRESLRTGRIALSDDLALLQNVPVRRGGDDPSIPRALSPTNEATLEVAPVFRWRGAENSEFQIIVTDRAGREIAKSGILAQNVWPVEKPLPAGFYFWKVTARPKGATEFAKTNERTMFKIPSAAEKRRLETAKNATKSNLAKAVLYARAGLLAEAERELQAELRKNPNSAKARQMLAQVAAWREK